MESLYRKYRPLTFESVVGQQHIVSTLEHAVTEGRLSHAYLFCGPRGTGKTTMARILAKSLLCQGAEAARVDGASGCMACGTCPECEAIAEGTHPDVYELDAASRTGVDNVREEIINSVSFAPVRGAYKVYIIDEVHMLTPAAFNALLKTLEEPPSHVVFILCTTDPQKILETILSRCQRFDFHRISNDDIVGRLRYICGQEGFTYDDEALEIVARHARGGMRDALSTLEQLSVFGAGAVRAEDARALLGEVASSVLAEFSCKVAVRDVAGLFELVRAQVEEGNDLLELTHDLVGRMRDVYTAAVAGPKPELFEATPEEIAAYVEEARLFGSTDRLARALTVLDDAALEMRNASDVRLVLEVALTRLARPEADLTIEALAERVARLEAQLAAGVPSGPMGAAPVSAPARPAAVPAPQPVVAPAPQPAPASAPAPAPQPAPSAAAPAPQPARPVVQPAAPSQAGGAKPWDAAPHQASAGAKPWDAKPAPSAPRAQVAPAPQAQPSPVSATAPSAPATPSPTPAAVRAQAPEPAAGDAGTLQRRWADAVKRVTAAQPPRGALLQSSRAVSDDGERLTVAFPKGSAFALKMISRPDSRELVTPIICSVFGERQIEYLMDGAPEGAPAQEPAAPASAPEREPAPGPVPAPEPAPQPVAARPVQPAPAPEPAPQPAPAPAAPAPAPAPADSASAPAPAVDQASGPTIMPEPDIEADRQAWADECVPYDDDMIAAYDDPDEVPPFDVPAPEPPVPAPAPGVAPSPGAAPSPFNHQVELDDAPQTPEEARALIEGVFGDVVFKPVDE